LIAEHTLDDLARPGGVDGFLFHFFVASGERGFHYFCGDRSGETVKEEVSTLVVPQGIFHEAEQFLERGDVGIYVRPFHAVVVEGGSRSLLFGGVLELLSELSFKMLP